MFSNFAIDVKHNEIKVKGVYYWELLFDVDNTKNHGVLKRTTVIKSQSTSNFHQMKKDMMTKDYKYDGSLDLSGKVYGVVDLSIKGSITHAIQECAESLTETRQQITNEFTKTETHEIGAKSKLKLYRLCFQAPGIRLATDTLASSPTKMNDVDITIRLKQILTLKDIQVSVPDDKCHAPTNMIEMVYGDDPNINAGYYSKPCYLVPIWSNNPMEAGSGIYVAIQSESNHDYIDMDRGASHFRRYLKILQSSSHNNKITCIGLYRTMNKDDDPRENGWEYRSIDINQGRGVSYLYLVWNVQSIIPELGNPQKAKR